MRRKIIKQGVATLTLSLPSKWAKKFNLKAGDELDVDEQDSNLLVAAKPREKKKEITVEITEANKEDIEVILTHLYRRGFDTITLKGVSAALMNTVTAVTKDLLLGFEVTEREGKQCKITNISEPTEEKYEVLLRRAFLIIKETQTTVLRDFEKGRFENMKEIEELRKQQDKFVLFCRRILTRERNSTIEWELLTFLMHIEHAYYYLYAYAYENSVKKNERIIELLKDLEKYFQLYYDAYYKKDMNAIHKINKLKKEFQFGKCYRYLEQTKGKETIVLSNMREIFRLIQIGSSPILSELLEKRIT